MEAIDRSFTARKEMLKQLKTNLQVAANRMKQQADRGRSEREFKVGEWVFLKLQSYRQSTLERRKSEKLSPRFYGPYEIVARVGPVAYTLKLPEGARIHPTFHVSLLKKCPDPSMVPVHIPEEAASAIAVKEPEEIVERRLIQRRGKAITEVLIRWKGEDRDGATWETWQELQQRFPDFIQMNHP